MSREEDFANTHRVSPPLDDTLWPSPSVTGVVLAGGAGKRLGRDKTCLQLPGMAKDFLGHAVDTLRAVVSDVRVSCREDSAELITRLSQEGLAFIPDLYPGEGTLRAVYSALSQVRRPCLCIACDMPFLTAKELATLLAVRKSRVSAQGGGPLLTAWRQQETGYVESLAAIYEPESLPFFESALARGEYQLNRVIPQDRWHCLDFNHEQAAPFWNVNHPADWDKALRQAVPSALSSD